MIESASRHSVNSCEDGLTVTSSACSTVTGKSTVAAAMVNTANPSGSSSNASSSSSSSDFFVSSLAYVLTHLVSLRGGKDDDNHPLIVDSTAAGAPTTGGNNLTVFHAVREPNVTIQDYLFRIARYFLCSPECFVMALIYVDRIMKRHSDFIVCKLNIHRLIVTSMMLAVKFFDDVYYSNAYYAKVGGVRASEMNVLEAHFLRLIDWHLFVTPEEFDLYKTNVLVAVAGSGYAAATKAGIPSQPQPPPRAKLATSSPVIDPVKSTRPLNDDGYDSYDVQSVAYEQKANTAPVMITTKPPTQ